jgi:CRISPR-associated protein (TIGR02710 family)
MSAALVLAATEFFERFSYVGGEQREKGGLGVTIDGKERILYQQNPWRELAIREVERACDLWASCQYDAVAAVFSEVSRRDYRPAWFSTLAQMAEAMGARHRLDFSKAEKTFAVARGKIRPLCEARESEALIGFVEESQAVCRECASGRGSLVMLSELLDNALRTAGQRRFEDAAARLYRVMEMQGQLWLQEMTEGAFVNGRLKAGATIPEALGTVPFCQPDKDGQVRLSLEQAYLALSALGHERGRSVAADLALERKSRWRQATEKRNTSILAHGVNPIGEQGFQQMKEIAADFLGFDFGRTLYPIPALDARWF